MTKDEVFKGLLKEGLFTEQLPPVFQSYDFYNFVIKKPNVSFRNKKTIPVTFMSMRNINIPRSLSIPNPFSHFYLCDGIRNYWQEISQHMENNTKTNKYKISRIHIRKLKDTDAIFKMNYKNFKYDGNGETDLLIGKRVLVYADISTFFPSIYTHSIPWAFVGKEVAKSTANKGTYYNVLDKLTRQTKENETHGILIGPHTSNIISEIILTKIDYELSTKGYEFIRHIDDYKCFTKNKDEAELFLIDLEKLLREYGLMLNHKKTRVLDLPASIQDEWTKEIKLLEFHISTDKLKYKNIEGYFDQLISLAKKNDNNMAILNYGLKVLYNKRHIVDLTRPAKKLLTNLYVHTTIIYPYLIRYIDKYLIDFLELSEDEIKPLIQSIIDSTKDKANYEVITYCLFLSLKYNFTISLSEDLFEYAKNSGDTVLLLISYLYCKKNRIDCSDCSDFYDYAKLISTNDPTNFDKHWLYVYEVLMLKDLKEESWRNLKNNNISFVIRDFR